VSFLLLPAAQVAIEDYEGLENTAPEELAAHIADVTVAEAELTHARAEEVRRSNVNEQGHTAGMHAHQCDECLF
jgi:hypothetical protein